MPEHLRALIVILLLSTSVFAFARKYASDITSYRDFTRRRNIWFTLTLIAFLAHSFWVYLFIAIPLLIYSTRHETNPPALFFFILLAFPPATISIPGMGLINYFFDLSHARVLALFILLPSFIALIRQSNTLPFGRTAPDKFLAAYILLVVLLILRGTTLTDTARQIFYQFIDVFLPYFVISRSLKNLQDLRDALSSFVMATIVVAPLAVFEAYKHWLLYQPLLSTLGMEGTLNYLSRDGDLRAVVTSGHSIALGYLMVVGLGFYLFLQYSIRRNLIRWCGMVLLTAGLIAALSRGPWIGAAVLLVVFILTGRSAVRRLVGLAIAAILAFSFISMLPSGEKIINLLPFIGSTEKGNINYREMLITNSMIVIQRNPWFGSIDYSNTPEMEAMRQGEGIIDIVNTYIGVALTSGLIGLGLFAGFFSTTLLGIYRCMRAIPDRDSEERLLGRALFATLVSILLMIFTVSSIAIIPIVYWSVAGLGGAFTQMVKKN
jgi:O-antigen ligase